ASRSSSMIDNASSSILPQPSRLRSTNRVMEFEAKAEQRRKDAGLSFEEKVEIVLALHEASRALAATVPMSAGIAEPSRPPRSAKHGHANQIRDDDERRDLEREHEPAFHLDDRQDREDDEQQRHQKAGQRHDAHANRSATTPHERHREHHEVR